MAQAEAVLKPAVRIDRGRRARRQAGEEAVAAGPAGAAAEIAPLVDGPLAPAPGEVHEFVAAHPQAGDERALSVAGPGTQVEERGERRRSRAPRQARRPGFEAVRFAARGRQDRALDGEGHAILAEEAEAAAAGRE